jgi:hypothetical protein
MKGDAHDKKLHLKYRSNGSAVRLACAYCKRVGRSLVQNVSTCCKIERQISLKPNLGAVSIFNLIYAWGFNRCVTKHYPIWFLS